MNIKIIGSGSYIPTLKIDNQYFDKYSFLGENGNELSKPTNYIIEKLTDITGISERRYADESLVTSDLAYLASKAAIENAGIDPESIDYIILAHNFGDVPYGKIQSDMIPSLASRVKNKLRIKNPRCIAYDIIFGCPGWIEGVIQATAFIKAGMAKRCLIIGAESLSRVIDPFDRDSMIYGDGSGATIVEGTTEPVGIISYESSSFTFNEFNYLYFGNSYNKKSNTDTRYIKMLGKKIFEFALKNVPEAIKNCLDKSNIGINKVKKILIHQANEKMDEAIVKRFYNLYDKIPPENILPMSIHKLGNSSVATIPTLYDLLIRGQIHGHNLNRDDIILFASIGAGMNINAMTYKMS